MGDSVVFVCALVAVVTMSQMALCATALSVDEGARSSLLASTCSAAVNINVTSGTTAGAKKFMVTPQDCCDYCGGLLTCTAATFWSYYCTPYSAVYTTAATPGPVLLSIATTTTAAPTTTTTTTTTTTAAPTTTTTTAAPTTFAPFTPVPQQATTLFAYLTTCPDNIDCGMNIYSCFSQVVPLNTCTYDARNGHYIYTTNNSLSISVTEYGPGHGCGEGAVIVKRTQFPLLCENINDGSMIGFVQEINEGAQVGAFSVAEAQFYESACLSDATTMFSTTSGSCFEAYVPTPAPPSWDSSSSSSSGSTPASSSSSSGDDDVAAQTASSGSNNPIVGAAQKAYCTGLADAMGMVVFAYPSMAACVNNMPVVGVGMVANSCYVQSEDSATWVLNTCQAEQKPARNDGN